LDIPEARAKDAALSLFRNGISRWQELDVLRGRAGYQPDEFRARSIPFFGS
jgi:hypothetical protein